MGISVLLLPLSSMMIENLSSPPITGFGVATGFKVLNKSMGPAINTKAARSSVNPMNTFLNHYCFIPSGLNM